VSHLFASLPVFLPGIEPDSVTYAILLTHFSRGCDWDQVDALLQEMHAKGMAARTAIYTAFIRQLCRTNQWNKALGLYLVMRDLGADITPAIYNDLLQVKPNASSGPCRVRGLLLAWLEHDNSLVWISTA